MTSVIIPWRQGCPFRERALAWVLDRWAERFPTFDVVLGLHEDGPWCKAAAVADGLSKVADGSLIIADADVWVDPTEAVAACATWAVPHLKVHRLSERSTARAIAGENWRNLPLDQSNQRDRKPYRGQPGGGVTVIRRDIYESCPVPRIQGWGQEDEAWSIALHCLYGEPWRGGLDLVHFWHPPQPRMSRIIGSVEVQQLRKRYRDAQNDPAAMRALVKEATCTPNAS